MGGGGGVANNKGADEPVHASSLISVIVILSLKSSITIWLLVKFQFSS